MSAPTVCCMVNCNLPAEWERNIGMLIPGWRPLCEQHLRSLQRARRRQGLKPYPVRRIRGSE